MRRRRLTSVLVGVACVTASVGATGALGAGVKHRAPARLLVYAQEWSLWPSRESVHSGKVIVELWNRGQDAHDLRIRRLRHGRMTGRTQGVKVTQSGGIHQSGWRLSPGSYELYCSMPGHLARGMHTRLIVR